MNFAVVEIAGKQFLARKDDVIEIPKISGGAGEKTTFSSVLLYWDGKKVMVGRPYLEGFTVEGRILEFGRSPKIVVYKFKRRKDSHRKMGHRQDFARIKIEKIVAPGKSAGKPEKPSARQPASPEEKAPSAEKPVLRKKAPAAKKSAAEKKPAPAKKSRAEKKSAPGKKSSGSRKSASRKKP